MAEFGLGPYVRLLSQHNAMYGVEACAECVWQDTRGVDLSLSVASQCGTFKVANLPSGCKTDSCLQCMPSAVV